MINGSGPQQQRTYEGSTRPTGALPGFVASSREPTCVVWVDVGLVDRYLYSLDDLRAAVPLQPVASGEHEGATVDVYLVAPH